MSDEKKWEGWAIINLMGHHQKSGYLSEQVIAGTAFIKLDIRWPGIDKNTTEFYAPGAVHSIIPCDEETALMTSNPEQPGLGLYTARQLLGAYDRLQAELRDVNGKRRQQPLLSDDRELEDDGIPY